jgi:hypothetical protein
VSCCFRKEKPADEADGLTAPKKRKSGKEDKIKEQSKLMYKYRDQLKKALRKKDLQYLLEYNDQDIPSGEDRVCIPFCYISVLQTMCVTSCRLAFKCFLN